MSQDISGIISNGDHEKKGEVHMDESGSDSNNSGRVQMDFQLLGMKPYKVESFISDKIRVVNW